MLLTRDDDRYYGKYIESASKTILVMGVTANRFLQDFADENSPHERKKVLLAALDRKVGVKLLIASIDHLDERQKVSFQKTKERCDQLMKKYPIYFDVRTFDHVASQAFVRIDEHVIVGPVFSAKASKDTPAIHVLLSSPFAHSYITNFENEWESAKMLIEK
jgi:hypothetical protein